MQLPGGIMTDGRLESAIHLAPMRGHIELTLAELADLDVSQPAMVSRFIAATIDRIGSADCDDALAGQLSVGDRHYLVRVIGAALGHNRIWLKSQCRQCGEIFEIAIEQDKLPVKPASADFPRAAFDLHGQIYQLRVPNGHDQQIIAEHLASGMNETAARSALARMLLEPNYTGQFEEADLARLEQVLEAMAPEVADRAQSNCPECDAPVEIEIDPYLSLQQASDEIFSDINVLARHYHWSEAAILAMPRTRRKLYLRLIDRDRGMQVQPEGTAGPP